MIIHNFCFSFFMCCKGKCFFINSKQIEEKNHSKQNNCKQSPPLNTHLSFRILYSELFLIKIHFQNIYKLNIRLYKVTTKKRNAERYSDRIELQGFQSCFRLFVKPSQSPLKPNQDAATLLVRNHARNGDKRTRITKQGVKD